MGVGFFAPNGRPPALVLALATTASDRALGAMTGAAGTVFEAVLQSVSRRHYLQQM